MDDVGKFTWAHVWVPIIAAVAGAVVRSLRDDMSILPNWPARKRLAFLGIISAISAVVDQVANGTDWRTAIVAFGITGLPGVIVELFHFLKKDDDDGPKGTGSIDLAADERKKKQQGTPYSSPISARVLMVMVAMTVVLPGCAWFREAQPKIIDVASKVVTEIEEVNQWVNLISDVAKIFFKTANLPEAETHFQKAEQSVKLALIGFTRAADAVKAGASEEYNVAYAELQQAFQAFLGAARSIGIVSAKGVMMVAKNGKTTPIEVPEALLFARKQ